MEEYMPFYRFKSKDGEEREEFFNMSELKDKINIEGKIFYRIPEFGTNIHYKGNGWTRNNTADLPSPHRSKADVGVKVDYDKKKEMEEAGEI